MQTKEKEFNVLIDVLKARMSGEPNDAESWMRVRDLLKEMSKLSDQI